MRPIKYFIKFYNKEGLVFIQGIFDECKVKNTDKNKRLFLDPFYDSIYRQETDFLIIPVFSCNEEKICCLEKLLFNRGWKFQIWKSKIKRFHRVDYEIPWKVLSKPCAIVGEEVKRIMKFPGANFINIFDDFIIDKNHVSLPHGQWKISRDSKLLINVDADCLLFYHNDCYHREKQKISA